MKVTGVPAQTLLAEADTAILTGKRGLTDIDIVFDVAGLFEIQTVNDELRMHCTWSPFAGAKLYTGLLPPALTPFTFHWYTGEAPGFVGIAVNETGVPEQTLLTEAEMDILAESPGFTVTVKSAGGPLQLPTLGVTE